MASSFHASDVVVLGFSCLRENLDDASRGFPFWKMLCAVCDACHCFFYIHSINDISSIFTILGTQSTQLQRMSGGKEETKVTRIGINYNPPSIVIEYSKKKKNETKMFHRKLNISQKICDSTESNHLNNVCKRLSEEFDLLHENQVPFSRLYGIVQKLWSRKRIEMKVEQNYKDLDLNLVSDQELKEAKDDMERLFCINKIDPDTEGYTYDKRVDFNDVQSDSSWD